MKENLLQNTDPSNNPERLKLYLKLNLTNRGKNLQDKIAKKIYARVRRCANEEKYGLEEGGIGIFRWRDTERGCEVGGWPWGLFGRRN